MEYRQLGSDGIAVSAIGMGCGTAFWMTGGEADAGRQVDMAIDLGITLFDTAENYGYGTSERMLGKALGGRRDKVVIASKASLEHMRAEQIVASCEGSLRQLETDYIDLYQIHWRNRDVELSETLGAMDALKRQGKVRAIGVSNFGVGDLTEAVKLADIVSNQVAYNLLFRAVEYDIKPLCVEQGIGILTYSPLMRGLLTGRYGSIDDVPANRKTSRHFSERSDGVDEAGPGCEAQTFDAIGGVRRISDEVCVPMNQLALAWLVRQDGVASVLAGASTVEQVRQNAMAGEVELTAETVAALSAATEKLKTALGPNPDLQCAESRIR